VPRLVGFLSEVEREFFELICEVDGVGVRKALRAIVRPVGEIATLIEEQDAKALATLPGIGAATAERMIAKLRRRMPKFALLVARESPGDVGLSGDVFSETSEVLRSLGGNLTIRASVALPTSGQKGATYPDEVSFPRCGDLPGLAFLLAAS
jgi:holliday junction DNA helicase RuvA